MEARWKLMAVVGIGLDIDGKFHALPWNFPLCLEASGSWWKLPKWNSSGIFHGYARWKLDRASANLPYNPDIVPSTSIHFHLRSPSFHSNSIQLLKPSFDLKNFRLTAIFKEIPLCVRRSFRPLPYSSFTSPLLPPTSIQLPTITVDFFRFPLTSTST